MNEPPWLEPAALDMVARILTSHHIAFGRPLLAGIHPLKDLRRVAQEVFAADQAVLAHNGAADPRLIYANARALQLWQRPWTEMIGLPSRLTAEPAERHARAQALAKARAQDALVGYSGVRVDSRGRQFRIEGAKLWTLRDNNGQAKGQAAAFGSWWWL